MGIPELLATSLAWSLSAMFALWLLSLRLRDASIVDIWWGPGFAAIALLSWWLSDPGHALATGLYWPRCGACASAAICCGATAARARTRATRPCAATTASASLG